MSPTVDLEGSLGRNDADWHLLCRAIDLARFAGAMGAVGECARADEVSAAFDRIEAIFEAGDDLPSWRILPDWLLHYIELVAL